MSQRTKRIPKLSEKALGNPDQFAFMVDSPREGDARPAGSGNQNPDGAHEGQADAPVGGVGQVEQNVDPHLDVQGRQPDLPLPRRPAPAREQRAGPSNPGSVAVPDDDFDDGPVLSGVSLRDLSAIVTAITGANSKRSADITRGEVPRWDRKSEQFVTFEQRVVMWMRSHDIEHLLKFEPGPDERSVHNKALMVITNQIGPDDRTTVHSMNYLCQVWSYLLAKHHPSDDADKYKLLERFDNITKGNRSVKSYHSEIISLTAQLTALGEAPPEFMVRHRMFKCGPEFDSVKYDLVDKPHIPPAAIMARYIAHEERHGLRAAGGPGAPAGGQGPGGRRGGPPRRQGQQGQQGQGQQVLGVGKKYLNPKDGCDVCGSKDHFKRDCPQLHEEVRKYLNAQSNARKAAAKARKRT